MRLLRRILRDERGDIEDLPGGTIIIIGIVIPLVTLVYFMGRYGAAETAVQSAASAAARDASLTRTAADAVPNARAAAERVVGDNVRCAGLDIQVDDDGLRTGLGQTGTVSATVVCDVATADLLFPLMPGSFRIESTAVSPVDPYRQR